MLAGANPEAGGGSCVAEPAFDVIVCGSLHLDVMVYAPRLPRPDETVPGTRWAQQLGGKGGNQAVMAARAGARTAMIGRVGADDFGARLLAHLKVTGVDARAISVDPSEVSGMSAAIVRDDGDYGAVIVSGANLHIPAGAVEAQWRELGGARVLVLQNEVPEAVNIAAAVAAKALGAAVVLNAAPARAATAAMLDAIDVLVVNRVEAEMLSGRTVTDFDSAIAALPHLAAPDLAVIVTLGGGGLVAQSPGEPPRFIPPNPVKVASTHGAGDCFVGALAARMAKGDSLYEAARMANLAAADFVAGASSG
jgi:ribokinase